MKKILMIVGSLRKGSFNMQAAQEVSELLSGRAQVSFLDYGDIPFMNQDIEFPAPEAVQKVRDKIADADGIWIFTPEYNSSIPGLLKNLLDWVSRPLKPNDWAAGSIVKGKAVTISGAAGKSGAKNARAYLAGQLKTIRMNLIGSEGTGIVLDGAAFSSGKVTLNNEAKAALQAQADEFLSSL